MLICIIGGFVYFIGTAVIDASLILLENAPNLIGRSLYQLQLWFEGVIENLPVEIQQAIRNAIIEGGVSLGSYIRDALLGGIASVPGTFKAVFGFAVLPVFLFYIMKDSERLKKGLSSALTPRTAVHARNVVLIVERVLGRYIRAQIMLGVIVAYFSFIGLWLLQVPSPA